jgi:hypothetical protein
MAASGKRVLIRVALPWARLPWAKGILWQYWWCRQRTEWRPNLRQAGDSCARAEEAETKNDSSRREQITGDNAALRDVYLPFDEFQRLWER